MALNVDSNRTIQAVNNNKAFVFNQNVTIYIPKQKRGGP